MPAGDSSGTEGPSSIRSTTEETEGAMGGSSTNESKELMHAKAISPVIGLESIYSI